MSIQKLEQCFIKNKNSFEPFISSINFISFKNFETNAEIFFDFPITVLVGKNGSNKSSALLALYGSVQGHVISEFWFTSAVDKSLGDNPRYFYRYKPTDIAGVAEVRMTGQFNKRSPDYWETAKPSTQDGMNHFTEKPESKHKTKTRWTKIDKSVAYINFKAQLSAFDKFFYHNKNPSISKTLKGSQQNYIRFHSNALGRAISNFSPTQSHYGTERILKPYELLSKEQVRDVSDILGKEYTKIGYIEHSFYETEGGTAIIYTDNMQYSEAFAGSGEFAIISMIVELSSCPENSLILLDEPETSLHPGAQKKLLDYLVKVALKHKHQIVISTHSKEMVESLPREAIKVFLQSKDKEKITILNNVDPSLAFNELGLESERAVVYVEDRLVKEIVDRIVRKDPNLQNKYVVKVLGSATSMRQDFTPMFAISEKENSIILLDGDQKTSSYIANKGFPSVNSILEQDVEKEIENYYGKGVKLFISGSKSMGGNSKERIDRAKCVYQFIYNNVRYLPSDNGETYLLDSPDVIKFIEDEIGTTISALGEKAVMKKFAEHYHDKREGEITSDDIFEAEKVLIHQSLKFNPECFDDLKEILF